MGSSVKRLLSCALGALLISPFLLFAKTATAKVPCDCICERGKTDHGIRVVMNNERGCDIYAAVKKYPQSDPATNLPYPPQVQYRSIFAANLERKADGTIERRGVLRGCTKDGKPSPDADSEEKKICGHLAFYYALAGVEITIPSRRTFTPAEQAELDAAASVERQKQGKAAEQKKDEERRELAAEKRVKELEKELEAQKAETKSRDDIIAANQMIAWRARFFTTAVVIIILAGIWSALMTLAAARLRFRLRPITADDYQYPDPLAAVRDMAIKLNGARTDVQEAKAKLALEQTGSKVRIAELERQNEVQKDKLTTATASAKKFEKESQGHKSNLEVLQKERGQGADGLKADIVRLTKQNEDLLAAWNDADEARIQLETWKRTHLNMLMERAAENVALRDNLERVEARNITLETENELLRYTHDPGSANETGQPADGNRLASAIDEPDEAVTQIRAPSVRAVPVNRRMTAPYPFAVGNRPSSTETAQPAGIESDLAIYRQGFEVIDNLLFWGSGNKPDDRNLEDRVRRTVEAVSDACSCAASARTQTSRPAAVSTGTIPPLSNSDIVRVAALMGATDDFDLPGFQRSLLSASNANTAECLKTCIHEWARRGERHGDLVYAIELPYELYDLSALLNSQLLYGEDIAPLVPDEYVDKLDRVKHAGEAVFARRPRMSYPPSAMPQTSG